jgi:hypothetical protein
MKESTVRGEEREICEIVQFLVVVALNGGDDFVKMSTNECMKIR